jgi:5'-3' exonuclease
MSIGYLLIDGSNVAHAANHMKPLKNGDDHVHAIFGFIRTLRPIVAAFPMLTPIVLWDGRSWRYDAFPEYKAKRTKEPTSKAEKDVAERRTWLKPQIPKIKAGLRTLGVRQVVAMNLEADDLAGMLVRRYTAQGKRLLLMTGDTDWCQLIGPGVGWWDRIRDVKITMSSLKEKLGVETPRQWLEAKCLMGDTSDDIPGVGGIGEKGALAFLNQYGSVDAFKNQYLDGTIKEVPKKFRDLIDDENKMILFNRNLELMDLNHPKIPKPQDLRIDVGAADRAAFDAFCEDHGFKSILSDRTFFEPFKQTVMA